MAMRLINVEVKGNRITLTREELMLHLEASKEVQKENKREIGLIALGYQEAIETILSHFEEN